MKTKYQLTAKQLEEMISRVVRTQLKEQAEDVDTEMEAPEMEEPPVGAGDTDVPPASSGVPTDMPAPTDGPVPAEPPTSDAPTGLDTSTLGTGEVAMPTMSTEQEVVDVLTDVTAVVQAAADAVSAMAGEVAGPAAAELSEALARVKKASKLFEAKAAKRKNVELLASLRKIRK